MGLQIALDTHRTVGSLDLSERLLVLKIPLILSSFDVAPYDLHHTLGELVLVNDLS